MKRGFLLSGGGSSAGAPSSESSLLLPVDTEECPVCLDTLVLDDTILLTCRHLLCTPCMKSLWALRRAENAATVHLECPVCRALVKVAHGDVAAFAAAHTASNFIGPVKAPRRRPRVDAAGLNTLTVPELLSLVRQLGLQSRISGQLERDDIERAIEAALPAPALGAAEGDGPLLGRLPVRALRAILELRGIPHGDCVEKADLVERALLSARGSCMALPTSLLLRMLRELEPAAPAANEQAELARQVMAARALRRAATAEAAAAKPAGGGGAVAPADVNLVSAAPPPPPRRDEETPYCCGACVLS